MATGSELSISLASIETGGQQSQQCKPEAVYKHGDLSKSSATIGTLLVTVNSEALIQHGPHG
jgi:hypothetical protein